MKGVETEGLLIELCDVGKSWNGRDVLDDITLRVRRGDFMAITGPNGGGKTTFLRILLKLLTPDCGTVRYFNDDGSPVDRLSIGYLPQKNTIDSRFPITVKEVVESGLLSEKGLSSVERAGMVRDAVSSVGLESHVNAPIGVLSGGQLQRALFARAIISRPEVLVLDEPLSYLDREFVGRIYEIVAELSKSTTIIIVSHEMSVISGMANRHLIIDRCLTECSSHHHSVHYDCDNNC